MTYDLTKEIWKPVVGYEGFYEVSNLGRVRSVERTARFVSQKGQECTRRVRARQMHCTVGKKSNRVSVMLSKCGVKKRVSVHRLVGMAFVPNPNPKEFTEINHIDENPQNNKADNLEWCNRRYNMTYGKMADMYKSNRRPIIADNGKKKVRYESIKDAVACGANRHRIMYALKNGNKVDGTEWRYEDGKEQGERRRRREKARRRVSQVRV